MRDATKAEGTTLAHFIRSAVVKELKKLDILPEIRELMKQQLNMCREFIGKMDVIIYLLKKGDKNNITPKGESWQP